MPLSFHQKFAALIIAVGLSTPAAADPELWKIHGWQTDFSKHSVPYGEIFSGGPPRDGIPSIDDPVFVAPAKITNLGDMEPVIRLDLNGDIRAYPLQVLTWHEIVNDVVAGIPVAVTYCPLCNSAIVFDRRVDGKTLEFGTTGLLRNSDLVMYDRQTQSWWQQFIGKGIVGMYTGSSLKMLPARVEAYGRFKAAHPDGKVLIPNNPKMRSYGRNPYIQYDSRSAPYPLYRGSLPDDINPMARVVVIKEDGQPAAVSLQLLRDRQSIKVGDVTLTWSKGQNSALDTGVIAKGRDVGNVVATRQGAKGAEPVVHDITFAFVVHAFYPDLKIKM